jgi:hypothetical protein
MVPIRKLENLLISRDKNKKSSCPHTRDRYAMRSTLILLLSLIYDKLLARAWFCLL